ncbi:MAG: response regulator [Chloroflexi bacterium]|nr:response regulator [Chloroflexota bacterium]
MAVKMRILWVDDDPMALASARRCLEGAGYEVLTAHDIDSAHAACDAHHPDLVALELLVPGGDSVQFCRHRLAQVPVVLLSSLFDTPAQFRAMAVEVCDCRASAYLVKPLTPEPLLQTVQSLLGQAPLEPLPVAPSVLVVADQGASLEALAEALTAQGLQPWWATGGPEALEIAAAQTPGVVVLDGALPAAADGGLAASLRALDAHLSLILLQTDEAAVAPPDVDVALRPPLSAAAWAHALRGQLALRELRLQNHHLTSELRSSGQRLVQRMCQLRRQTEEVAAAYAKLLDVEAMREHLYEMVAHDLGNPLGVIIGAVELLEEDLRDALNPDMAEILALAGHAATQMLALVENLLGVQRLEEGKMPLELADTDLLELLHDAALGLKPQLAAKGLTLQLDAPASLPLVWADWSIARRVLNNLLDNSIKFSPRAGVVRLEAAPTEGGVLVAVSDSGPGIAPEDRERIFNRFEQVRQTGSRAMVGNGLGLAFCKLAVEAHGGSIWVESNQGTGSRFCFILPTATKA